MLIYIQWAFCFNILNRKEEYIMKISLQINGRKMTFSEEELTAILEKHFSEEMAETAKTKSGTKPAKTKATKFEVAKVPTEGKCFGVNPMGIDRSLFQGERSDSEQEKTRQYILEAFAEVDKHPDEYAKPFKTLRPKKTWKGVNTGIELKQYAENLGGHYGNKTRKALQWAQRISNGEKWEEVCNTSDTAECCELVDWEIGYSRLVGGKSLSSNPATYVSFNIYRGNYRFDYFVVPFVVFY